MNILGISTEIRDNSLICIDEPELSLHPKWQEKYMKLLMNTFSDYKKFNGYFQADVLGPAVAVKFTGGKKHWKDGN